MTAPETTQEAAAPRKFMRKIAFFPTFGGLLFGYDTGLFREGGRTEPAGTPTS